MVDPSSPAAPVKVQSDADKKRRENIDKALEKVRASNQGTTGGTTGDAKVKSSGGGGGSSRQTIDLSAERSSKIQETLQKQENIKAAKEGRSPQQVVVGSKTNPASKYGVDIVYAPQSATVRTKFISQKTPQKNATKLSSASDSSTVYSSNNNILSKTPFEQRIEGLKQREQAFFSSKGFQNIRGISNIITLGGGTPYEQRSFIGKTAETTVYGFMSWPISLGGGLISAGGKLAATFEGLSRKEYRSSVISEIGRSGKETLKVYDVRKPEGVSTFITAGTFAFFPAAGKYVAAKAKITTVKGENILSRQTEGGVVTVAESGARVKIGSKSYDVYGKVKEYAVQKNINTQQIFTKAKFKSGSTESSQISTGVRVSNLGKSSTISDFAIKTKSGSKTSFQTGKTRTDTFTVIENQGLNTEAVYSITKASKTINIKNQPLSNVFSKTKVQKPYSVEVGLVKETAKINQYTFGKGKTVEISGKSNLAKFTRSWQNNLKADFVQQGQGNVNLISRTSGSSVTSLNVGLKSTAQTRYTAQVVNPQSFTGKAGATGVSASLNYKPQKSTATTNLINTQRSTNKVTNRSVIMTSSRQNVGVVNATKSISVQESIQKPLTRTSIRTSLSLRQNSTQIQRPAYKTMQKESTVNIQKSLLVNVSVSGSGGRPSPRIVTKTILPPIPNLGGTKRIYQRKKRTSFSVFTRPFRYTSSIRAAAFNIRGTRPKLLTGVELRPLLRR